MNIIKRIIFLLIIVATLAVSVAYTASASGQTDGEAAPIYGIKIPPGYRDWTLISMARVGSPVNDMRAKLGNDIAIKAYRDGKPFPDGAIIARLAWNQSAPEENNNAVRAAALERGLSPDAVQKLLNESFVAGSATNVQFMVKDSKKYAATGGWGFAQFTDGKPVDDAIMRTCFPCHQKVKERDLVFTRYAP